jgi:WD40 repeat protein
MMTLLLLAVLLSGDLETYFEASSRIFLDQEDEIVGSVRDCLVTPDNRLIIVDSRNKHLKVFDMEGNLEKIVGRQGQGPGEFAAPFSLAGNADHVFVADPFQQKVHLFDSKSLAFVRSLEAIDGTDISVDASGTVFLGAARPHEDQT